MAEIIIRELPEAEEIAEELIADYHEHLRDATILYLLTSQKRKSRGQVVLGTAGKMAPLQRYLSSGAQQSVEAGADFILIFTEEAWTRITPEQRRAAVDHELCHCARTETETKDGDLEYTWSLRHHDVEAFEEEIERHGLWKRELRDLGAVIQQLPLDLPKPARAAPAEARQFVQAAAAAEPPVVCYECHAPIPDGTAYHRDTSTGTPACGTCYERLPNASSQPAPLTGEALVDEIARRADGQTIQVRDGVTATITAGAR